MSIPHDITQQEMAEFLDESQQYISRLINNKIVPRIGKLKKFARRTNTDISFWITSTKSQKKKVIKQALDNQKKEKINGLRNHKI